MRDIAYTEPKDGVSRVTLAVTGGLVSGLKLLAQRVITVVCTNLGETLRLSEGTNVLTDLGNAAVDDGYMQMIILSAMPSVVESIKADQDIYPSSEQLGDISVDSVSTSADSVEFVITVTSVDGASTSVSSQVAI